MEPNKFPQFIVSHIQNSEKILSELKMDIQPIQWLRKIAISKGGSGELGNPVISFHLTNLLFRFKFIMSFCNSDIYNNYEFWNFRSLRQFCIYLLKFDIFETIVIPYLGTIGKNVRKYELLDEISGKVPVSQINTAVKCLISENDETSRKMREKLMEKLVKVSAEEYRKKKQY